MRSILTIVISKTYTSSQLNMLQILKHPKIIRRKTRCLFERYPDNKFGIIYLPRFILVIMGIKYQICYF